MIDRHSRVALDVLLLALALTLVLLVAASVDGPRPAVALLAAALVPGGALLTRWPVTEPLTWLGLAVAFSLAIETIGSLLLVWLGFWHPEVLAGVLGSASCCLLAADVRRAVRPVTA